MRHGGQTLAYGTTPEDALGTLRARLPAGAADLIDPNRCRVIRQRDLQRHLDRLG
jgi:hypothetical protein